MYRTLGEAHKEKGAYAQALTNYEEFLALLSKFALSEETVKAYTTMMQYCIQNVQEEIDKQNQAKEEKENGASEK